MNKCVDCLEGGDDDRCFDCGAALCKGCVGRQPPICSVCAIYYFDAFDDGRPLGYSPRTWYGEDWIDELDGSVDLTEQGWHIIE